MLLLVFVRSPLAPCFTSIHTSNVGAGLMGMMVRLLYLRGVIAH
jgi:hypothetical protein